MVTKKNLFLALFVAATLGLGASSSFASGPFVLGPTTAPIMPKVVTVQTGSTMQTKALSIYRQVRSFWLSRAIVR